MNSDGSCNPGIPAPARPDPPAQRAGTDAAGGGDGPGQQWAGDLARVYARVADLVNGKAALSPEMALWVKKAFGVSVDTPLRTQAWHNSHTMRERAGEIDVELA